MSKPKYKQGKQITTIAEFANSKSMWFKVHFGNQSKTIHRSFLISWQYRLLERFIDRGCIFEADSIVQKEKDNE